jgi:hypothetical protein
MLCDVGQNDLVSGNGTAVCCLLSHKSVVTTRPCLHVLLPMQVCHHPDPQFGVGPGVLCWPHRVWHNDTGALLHTPLTAGCRLTILA